MPGADLTQAERDQISQVLSQPLKFPEEFKNWLSDFLALNIPYIPVSQIQGYKGTLANNAIVNTAEAVDGTWAPERTWNDLPSAGPTVSGLADGTYFCAWGNKTGRGGAGGAHNRTGVSVNGADPSGTNYTDFAANDPDSHVWKACSVTAQNNDNNTIQLKYWYDLGGGGLAQFEQRWLTVLRIT